MLFDLLDPLDLPSRLCDATPSPRVFGHVPMTGAYNHFINVKNIYKSSHAKVESLN